MDSQPEGDASGFMILSDPDFERLSLEERVIYMKAAVVALQRLQKQIHLIVEEVAKKPAP